MSKLKANCVWNKHSFLLGTFIALSNFSFAQSPPIPPPDTSGARQAGQNNGFADGAREAAERAGPEGEREGRERGYNEGYQRCYDDQAKRNYDIGYADGFQYGENRGATDGERQGRSEGDRRGESEGHSDGLNRADRDADAAATPPGRRQGIDEANQTDARERGYRDGLVAGEQRARRTAIEVDYPKGRKDYRDSRFAEPIENQDEFDLSVLQPLNWEKEFYKNFKIKTAKDFINRFAFASPDYRHSNPNGNYSTPEENSAYSDGYRSGYDSGFSSNYSGIYDRAYHHAFQMGSSQGCHVAQNQDFSSHRRRGYDSGESDGYSRGYQPAYDRAYRWAYDSAFRSASDSAYRSSYDDYYRSHYESARRDAYESQVRALYNAGHQQGDAEKFAEKYPLFAKEEYARGVADETTDFTQRPVRMLEAEISESIVNGLMEPLEKLRFKVQLRNFANHEINPKDISLTMTASNGVIIALPQTHLTQNLKVKSFSKIKNALEFSIPESLVNKSSTVNITATYMGREIGVKQLQFNGKYLTVMTFAEKPQLLEGMPTEIIFKVKNQSTIAETGALNLSLKIPSTAVEVITGESSLTSLKASGEGLAKFKILARTSGMTLNLPLVLSSLQGTRRVGLLDSTSEVPVVNDYRITLMQSPSSLKNKGVSRLTYTLKNISSRLVFKGLQLKVKVLGANSANFSVIGPQPQLLSPMEKGQAINFVVPVLSKNANSGGTVELEVREDGKLVVIHHAKF